MKTETAIKDWSRMHAALGYKPDGKGGFIRDDELVDEAKRLAAKKQRMEEKRSDTGL